MNNYIQIAKLVQACGKIEGRVKLQKIVHILQDMGHPFCEEFGYLHHGPYSSDLKSEIDQLRDWKLIKETEAVAGQYARYDYTTDEKLPSVFDQLGDHSEPEWAEIARGLNQKSAPELEAISTIMFLRSRGFEGERLKTRFDELKPHLRNQFESCAKEAERFRSTGRTPCAAAND